jgi:plastocyanin
MNTKLIYMTIFLLTLGAVAYFTTQKPIGNSSNNHAPMETDQMEEHFSQMNDGKTIMIMAGRFNPETLYIKPGTSLRFVNHESVAMSIQTETQTLSKETKTGEESEFKAPMQPGTYQYTSSANTSIKGTIVVEE